MAIIIYIHPGSDPRPGYIMPPRRYPNPSDTFPYTPFSKFIDLTLHTHADNEITAVFVRSTADNSVQVHLSHQHIPLTIGYLRRLYLTL